MLLFTISPLFYFFQNNYHLHLFTFTFSQKSKLISTPYIKPIFVKNHSIISQGVKKGLRWWEMVGERGRVGVGEGVWGTSRVMSHDFSLAGTRGPSTRTIVPYSPSQHPQKMDYEPQSIPSSPEDRQTRQLGTLIYCSAKQCSQPSGGPAGPAGGLPRAPDGTGRLAVVRPVLPKGRTAVFGQDGGPYRVRHISAGQGRWTARDCRG